MMKQEMIIGYIKKYICVNKEIEDLEIGADYKLSELKDRVIHTGFDSNECIIE